MNKFLLSITFLTVSACSLAPDFELPEIALPDAFKEQSPPAEVTPLLDAEAKGTWQPALPLEAADRGQWWLAFDEEALNALEEQAMITNFSLLAAAERVEQARALVRASAASFFPSFDLGANAVRAKPGSAGTVAFGGNPSTTLKPYTLYEAQASASYEVDLFGRVRDNEAALAGDADAQESTYQSVLLALQADVAQHYFSLRALDTERILMRDTVAIREEAARIMARRFELGVASEADATRTQSELASTHAELLGLDRRRAALEHALAVLLGKLPSEFSFAEAPLIGAPPEIPPGLPSTLLTRRPDIAASASMMAAANKRIGVARTAFFPIIGLHASGGAQSTSLSDLFEWSSRTWALGQLAGPAITWSIFNSGRDMAKVDAADAAYYEALANYRQQVLVAFREVEDNLSEQRLLSEQSQKLDEAARAATRTTELVRKRYDEGDIHYFEVVDAQRTSLAAERASVQIRGQRFLAAIGLIRALGGEWRPPAQAAPAIR